MVFAHDPENTYSSTDLSKVSEVINEDVSSLRDAIRGEWEIRRYGEEYLVEFIANHMAITYQGDASGIELYRYEFVEPYYIYLEDLNYFDSRRSSDVRKRYRSSKKRWR